jgi:hypothetical protein
MAAKKKTRKKPVKSKPAKSKSANSRISRKKPSPRKSLARKKPAIKGKKSAPKKKVAKKTAQKKVPAKLKARGGRITGKRPATVPKKPARAASSTIDAAEFSVEKPEARSGLLSGDLQGLSNVEGADSESVDELLEEGNAFEADAVAGVEEADNAEGKEVRTREVPEDDVPEEYLDQD